MLKRKNIFMKKHLLSFYLILTVSYFSYGQPFTGCPDGSEVILTSQQVLEDSLFDIINQVRKDTFGVVNPLIRDVKLDYVSRYQAIDMKTDAYFCHSTCDKVGSFSCSGFTNLTENCNWFDRISKFVGTHNYNRDCLAFGQKSAKEAVIAWLNDPPHRAILGEGQLKYGGVGVVTSASGLSYYWVFDASDADSTLTGTNEHVMKDYSISDASPNPMNNQASIHLRINQTQNVKIEVLNSLGQKVINVFEGKVEAGKSSEFIIKKAGLPAGIYFYRVRGEKGINHVRKITVQ